ncbi:MAG: AAA family ATPase [Planctomycetes bacterium]|nr:AAA family ATPase [Planctomycetota bacterium]
MSDLWATQRTSMLKAAEPLAVRMRPRSIDEFVGQSHFLGEGKLLRRMLEADRITSVIFHGPPGSGKTTLAEIIANSTHRHFERANAATIGVKEIRFVIEEATRRLTTPGSERKTILFLDEIHRFSKSQQDVLLGDVERGVITLIGATTENPFFSVNSALISRSQVFSFEPLPPEAIKSLLHRAISDEDRGYGKLPLEVTEEALDHWATMCDGDARRALTALEIAVLSTEASAVSHQQSANQKQETPNKQHLLIDLPIAQESIQRKAIQYDPTGDAHYDAISAFIKSMRGSDPDATAYWLARMIVAGEDPLFIARRIAILASEDVGNADPRAMQLAAAAYTITERVGLPECQLTLAQAAIYMACAPKSNASATAIWNAVSDVKNQRTIPVPKHLRDAHYAGAKKLGHTGYQYAHDSEKGYVEQDYLGVEKKYYEPTDRGYEKHIRQYLQWIGAMNPSGGPASE